MGNNGDSSASFSVKNNQKNHSKTWCTYWLLSKKKGASMWWYLHVLWQLWRHHGYYKSLVKYRKLGLTCCYAIQTLCNVIGTSLSELHTSNNSYVINYTQNTTIMIRLFTYATRIQWYRLQYILIWFVLLSTISEWCKLQ